VGPKRTVTAVAKRLLLLTGTVGCSTLEGAQKASLTRKLHDTFDSSAVSTLPDPCRTQDGSHRIKMILARGIANLCKVFNAY